MFGVRKLAAIEVVPHIIAVPPQPVNNSIPGLVNSTPRLLNVIVGLVVCAINLYQMSYTTVPAQSPAMVVGVVRVVPYIVAVVFTQLVDEVKVTALPQTSFAGAGSSTQIVKFPVAAVVG